MYVGMVMTNSSITEPSDDFEALSLNASDLQALGAAKLSDKSMARKDAQRGKRRRYFVKRPLTFEFILRAIPDPTSRVVLVAKAFTDMNNSGECVLRQRVWECAGVKTPDHRRRILARLRKLPALRIIDRLGRPSVVVFS